MALFTDFFPTTGSIRENQQDFSVAATFALGTNTGRSRVVTLTANTPPTRPVNIQVGDSIEFSTNDADGERKRYVGIIADLPAGTNTISVELSSEEQDLPSATEIIVDFYRGGQTLFIGDVEVGGDVNVAGEVWAGEFMGDLTGNVTGDLTGNADTATALATARDFTVSGDATTSAAVSFNGSGNVDLAVSLAAGVVGSDEIASDAVTAVKINSDVAGDGLSSNAATGALDVNLGTGLFGLQLVSDALQVRLGTGLSFNTSTGAIQLDSLDSNNTLFFASTVSQTEAEALTGFVGAFNAATGSAPGTNAGFTVPAGQRIDQGDLVLIQFTDSANSDTITTESFIHLGATVIAPADVVEANFVDITHAGDVVETFTAGDGLTAPASQGNVTASIELQSTNSNLVVDANGLALDTNVDVQGTLDVTAATTLDSTLTVEGAVDINDSVDVDGALFTVDTTGDISLDSTAGNVNLSTAGGTASISSTAIATLSSTGATATVSGSTGVNITGVGANADVTISAGSSAAVNIASPDIASATTRIVNIGRQVNTGGRFIGNPVATVNIGQGSGTSATNIQAGSDGVTILAESGLVSIGNDTGNGVTINAGTATGNNYRVTAGGSVFSQSTGTTTINGQDSVLIQSLSSNSDVTIRTTTTGDGANINLNARGSAGEIRISGNGISTATDDSPLGLVVGADGHVFTSSTSSSNIVSTVIFAHSASGGAALRTEGSQTPANQSSAGDAVTTPNSGDIIVLQPTGSGSVTAADRTLSIGRAPSTGTFYEFSNLAATTPGSGLNRWIIGSDTANALVVMGSEQTAGFTLDDETASFKFLYTGTPYGWVVIGAN